MLCTTATANDRVVADVVDQLGDDLHVTRGRLDREALHLAVGEVADPATRMAWRRAGTGSGGSSTTRSGPS